MKLTSFSYHPVLSRYFSGTKFFLIAAIVLMASCKKESALGSDIQPDGDLIDLQYTDTLSLFSYTMKEDSLRSDESGIVQIGDIRDAYFGKTQASLFTQVVIPNNLQLINFGTNPVFDSCALNIAYDYEYYGDTLDQQTYSVYQVTESMFFDSTYYSNQVKQCYPTYASRISVGDTTLAPRPHTKTIVGGDTLKPLLRIPIETNFAQQIFNQGNTPNLASTEAFLQYMKGLHIEANLASGSHGSLMRFNLKDTSTKFIFYYHNASDTTTFSFVVNTATAYFSHYTHDYSSVSMGDLNNQLNNPGVNTSNEVFVSGASGVKTKITFPYLENLRNLGYAIAINKAELIFKADQGTTENDLYPINRQLYVVSIDSIGQQLLLPDMFESASYFGGSAITTTHEYHINIARYFQQLMEGSKPNNGLYLKEFDPNGYGRRAVLGSGKQDPTNTYKMYIHLVYTRIN